MGALKKWREGRGERKSERRGRDVKKDRTLETWRKRIKENKGKRGQRERVDVERDRGRQR